MIFVPGYTFEITSAILSPVQDTKRQLWGFSLLASPFSRFSASNALAVIDAVNMIVSIRHETQDSND